MLLLNPAHHLTGYHPYEATRKRRAVLRRLCTSRAIMRRINVLAIFTRWKHPKLHQIYRDDMAYLQGLRARMI
jgi:hypothetical protein